MNVDMALIAKLLDSGDMGAAIKAGAGTPHLFGDEAQAYWELLTNHYKRFHEVPSVEYFITIAPSYVHASPGTDSIEALVHELKTQRLGRMMQEVIVTASDESW